MLSGDNGILQKATTAKENTDNAQIKERIQLAYHSALAGGQGSYTKESLEEELEKEFGENNYSVDDSDNINWVLSAKGQDVTIPAGKKDSQDTGKVTIKVGTTNLKYASDLTTLYGETTDYTSISGVNWQLFYSDDEWIYLIANDYVPIDTLPNELIKETQEEGETKYKACFAIPSNSVPTGTIMETSPWSSGVDSSTIVSNTHANKYLKWINSSLVSTKNNSNMKAVAYMLDTSKWRAFVGNEDGSYAIGGPTLEMFVLSYNAKHDTKLGIYETIDSTNANENGYKVKVEPNSWTYVVSDLDTSSDNMWIKTNSNIKAMGMWLASPSAVSDTTMHGVYNEGGLYYGNSSVYTSSLGFRPVISVPKSSLK